MTHSGLQAVVGWREWLALPELGIPGIKAKIDTGARTSALHAYFVEPYREAGNDYVRFGVHPLLRRENLIRICCAPVRDRRQVADSGGHREERYVIETLIQIGELARSVEMTLTNRDSMKFRMLLGRSALQELGVVVDPSCSYQLGLSLRSVYKHEMQGLKK
jgi:hypothetical protein